MIKNCVSVEPIMGFDLEVLVEMIKKINPIFGGIVADSKKFCLPEPSLDKVKRLHWELSRRGFVVILKTIREEENGRRGVG